MPLTAAIPSVVVVETQSGDPHSHSCLAGQLEIQFFKVGVRKLKELALAESLDVGYRLSAVAARACLKTMPRLQK